MPEQPTQREVLDAAAQAVAGETAAVRRAQSMQYNDINLSSLKKYAQNEIDREFGRLIKANNLTGSAKDRAYRAIKERAVRSAVAEYVDSVGGGDKWLTEFMTHYLLQRQQWRLPDAEGKVYGKRKVTLEGSGESELKMPCWNDEVDEPEWVQGRAEEFHDALYERYFNTLVQGNIERSRRATQQQEGRAGPSVSQQADAVEAEVRRYDTGRAERDSEKAEQMRLAEARRELKRKQKDEYWDNVWAGLKDKGGRFKNWNKRNAGKVAATVGIPALVYGLRNSDWFGKYTPEATDAVGRAGWTLFGYAPGWSDSTYISNNNPFVNLVATVFGAAALTYTGYKLWKWKKGAGSNVNRSVPEDADGNDEGAEGDDSRQAQTAEDLFNEVSKRLKK